MDNPLINYFSQLTTLSTEEAKLIADSMAPKSFKKNTFLLKEGQYANETYFVIEGCVRQYILVDGEEKTTNFFTENQWIISPNSLIQNAPATHFLVCLEDCLLVVGNEAQAQAMFKQFPRFETIARIVVETAFAEQQKQMTSFFADSPTQRYINLLNTRPNIFQRVPQYQLASYIGVKPESLSRIRKRINAKP